MYLLVLALISGFVACRNVAIIISGGPRPFACSWDESDAYYRMVSDGLVMAEFLHNSGYEVHCLYSVSMIDWYDYSISNLTGDNALLHGDGIWKSDLGDEPIWFWPKRRTLRTLEGIHLQDDDRVVLYIRSHGSEGGFDGPYGTTIGYDEVLKVFTRKKFTGEMLWLVDACHSGTIITFHDLFARAQENGLNCRVITSTDDRTSISNFRRPVEVSTELYNGQRRVGISSYFRHRLMVYIDQHARVGVHGGVAWASAVQAVGRTTVDVFEDGALVTRNLGCIEFSFGSTLPYISDWISVLPDEPDLGIWNGASGRSSGGEASELCEHWSYGTFVCSLPEDPVSRKRALYNHARFGKLIRSVYRDLNISLGRRAAVPVELTKAQLAMFYRLLRKVDECVYLERPHFHPNYNFLKNLVVTYGKDESAIVRAIEKASKAYGLSEIPKPIGDVIDPFAYLERLEKAHLISESDKVRISSKLSKLLGSSKIAQVGELDTSRASHKRSRGRQHRHRHDHRDGHGHRHRHAHRDGHRHQHKNGRRHWGMLKEADYWIDPSTLCYRPRLGRGRWE